jgi:hypothetical protein
VAQVLTDHGWQIETDQRLDDDEFCFEGPTTPDVLDAWRARLGFIMPRFIERFGGEAVGFDSAFLECLTSESHRSDASVWFILARAPAGGADPG